MGKNKRGSGSRKPSGSSGVGGAGSFALGLALGAIPAIKKTHAMSMKSVAETPTARKRGRGARPVPPLSDEAPPGEASSSSTRTAKKQRPANPDYDDAYRNFLERTQGQARSQAFHQRDAQKRRAQSKTRDGLIAPATFVNTGGAPAVAAAALAGAATFSVKDFVEGLCAGLEERQEEEASGAVSRAGSGAGGKDYYMNDKEGKAGAPENGNPFAALGSDDEGDEDRRGRSPAVVFQPSVLCPPPVLSSQSQAGISEEAPTTQCGGGKGNGAEEDEGKGGTKETEDAWNSLSMDSLSSSLLDVEALQPQRLSLLKHEEKEKGNDEAPPSTTPPSLSPPPPTLVTAPVTAPREIVLGGVEDSKAIPVVSTGGDHAEVCEASAVDTKLEEAQAAGAEFEDL